MIVDRDSRNGEFSVSCAPGEEIPARMSGVKLVSTEEALVLAVDQVRRAGSGLKGL